MLIAWHAWARRSFPWRADGASLYVKILVEVLLQRTRAETVARFLPGFLDRFPSWAELAVSDERALGEALKPIGLWRRRAAPLHSLALAVVESNESWPIDRESLEALPAVGQYIANAILLFVHGQRQPLMDASMARLLRRYFDLCPQKADIRHDPVLHETAYKVLAEGDAVELNWAMLDLAAMVCLPRNPRCEDCPLKRTCRYRLHCKKMGTN
ncbi:hypothetical protein ACFOKJ_03335 [Vogesella amnigena]|uniref:HhH-GPD domain-containing protein n=1 Tax=Vogesella amnigena TaxID=1507449 RepID=A0ABV7TPG4_9NEIS